MNITKNEKGFTLIEVLVVAVLVVLVGAALGAVFIKKSKIAEDNELAKSAHTTAENALEILSNLPKSELQNGGTFSVAGDNQITITQSCSTQTCDWFVSPNIVTGSESLAKGLPYQSTVPEGKVVLLRRWLIEDIDASLGLKRITVAILTAEDSTKPLAIYKTVVAKE